MCVCVCAADRHADFNVCHLKQTQGGGTWFPTKVSVDSPVLLVNNAPFTLCFYQHLSQVPANCLV